MSINRRGFTLIEILVVVSVLAILLSVVAFSGAGARDGAKVTQAEASIEQLHLAFKLYREATGHFPPSEDICSLCTLRSGGIAGARSEWDEVVTALEPTYMNDSIARDPWGNPYAYDNNFRFASQVFYTVLCSMGPDGELQTFLTADVNDYLLTVPDPVAQGDDVCIFLTGY